MRLTRGNIENILALSPMQEGLLFQYQLNPESQQYFEQLSVNLSGQVVLEEFKEAWDWVVQSNEMLRTVFQWEKLDKPVQVVLKVQKAQIMEHDLSSIAEEDERREALERLKALDRSQRFDLANGPLLRITLCKMSSEDYEMLISNHHILFDGWSTGVILKEFFTAYDQLVGQERAQGRQLARRAKAGFKDYLKWYQKQDTAAQLSYWREYLLGFETKSVLPVDFKKVKHISAVKTVAATLPEDLALRVQDLSKELQITAGTIYTAAFGLLLQRYNDQDDVVFGTTVAGRPEEVQGVEEIVGLFINTLPMRVRATGDRTLREILARVQEDVQAGQRFASISPAQVKACSVMRGEEELFDSLFVFENYPLEERLGEATGGLNVTGYSIFEMTNYDLVLEMTAWEGVQANFVYNPEVFRAETVERMAGHYQQLLGAMVLEPARRLDELEMITAEEKRQVLIDFNNTQVSYPAHLTIPQLFEEQVALNPEKLALVFEGEQLTYSELNARANQLARILRAKGVRPDQPVAVMVERSLEMIIGVLAIVKAGGAYLPIDLAYPLSRISYMLKDSGAELLLVQSMNGAESKVSAMRDTVDPAGTGLVESQAGAGLPEAVLNAAFAGEIIDLNDRAFFTGDSSNLENINAPEDLIYIIYTSGSTGEPKGVMVEHRNVNRLISNSNMLVISPNDRIMQTGSLAFDASTFELWGAFLNGATLYLIARDDLLSAGKFGAKLAACEISMVWLTAPFFNQLLDEEPGIFAGLKTLLVGGDALSPRHINLVRRKHPALKVINGYGPTESTTFATYFRIEQDYPDNIPIGWPVSNTQVYIFDRYNHLQPVGIPGELCIGGDGLARGYWHSPALTADKFVTNPLTGERMYRTGDLARWRGDGSIEFLGRVDQQVKIRGFRIEPGEIEAHLLTHPALKDAAVVCRTDGNGSKYLAAYYVGEGELAANEVRDYLALRLPEYMIPSYFVGLEHLPLTVNGKVDRRALPEPAEHLALTREYIAPANEVEEKLAGIWANILGLTQVSVTDNFFEVGGHSLKATQLVSKIAREFEIGIPLKEIFANPTVRGIAEYLRQAAKSEYIAIEQVPESEYYQVSSAQKRLYVLNQFEGSGTSYNIPAIFEVTGELDIARLNQAFAQLIARHETLRTYFTLVDGEPVQKVAKEAEFIVRYTEITTGELECVVQGFVRPFDLGVAPLMRAELVQARERCLLLFDIHHIIADGSSMGILVDELTRLYNGEDLPLPRVQYKDFAAWQNGFLGSELMQKQESYWLEALAGEVPVLDLPLDYARPLEMTFEGDSYDFAIGAELTAALHQLAAKTDTTLYMVLLAVYQTLLARYSGQEDIVIGSPIAGRTHAELEGMVGMFVNTLAMRNYPAGQKGFLDFLKEVKESALQAFQHQDYQFEQLVERLDLRRDMSRNPLFDVIFVLQNAALPEFSADGFELTQLPLTSKMAKFDITLAAVEQGDRGINFNLEYRTGLFKRATIERMAGHFVNLLMEATANPKNLLGDFRMLSQLEEEEILTAFNATAADYPEARTLKQIFEAQVARFPERTALVYGEKMYTYGELNARANQLAWRLREQGVASEQIVGMLLERSPEMLIGILAIIKAGGAYLPIDPDYPGDRIAYMLEDAAVSLLLTGRNSLQEGINFTGQMIDLTAEGIYTGETCDLPDMGGASDLAYIIYTSGSTGRPKGVMIEHRSVVNTLYALQEMYPVGSEDAYLLKTAYTFDVSVAEIFGWILGGGRLVILQAGDEKDPVAIIEAIGKYAVTHVNFVPSMFNIFLSTLEDGYDDSGSVGFLERLATGSAKSAADLNELAKIRSLKYIFVAGEAIQKQTVERFLNLQTGIALENIYGPTEATIYATYYALRTLPETVNVPIGKPLANLQAYIFAAGGRLQPIGVAGELCISGRGLARGYLKRPELTQEKFVLNPVAPGEMMYRTGDLVKWLADGNIEYLGRIDHQVKIRGFRIELGEIEAQIREYPAIQDAIVIARTGNDGTQYLCAYLLLDVQITTSDLVAYLKGKLPEYMVPAFFIELAQWPLTSSGKIDRRALPAPDFNSSVEEYVAPANTMEERLARLWAEILGVTRVGVTDNFFALGGHSLKATRLVAVMHREFGVDISLKAIFKSPTVRELAQFIDGADSLVDGQGDAQIGTHDNQQSTGNQASEYRAIAPVGKREYYPVSSAQKRLFVLKQLDGANVSYNIPAVLKIEGDLDFGRLTEAFQALVQRHEALRTSFTTVDGEPVQIVHDFLEAEVGWIVSEESIETMMANFVQPFEVSQAPLVRAALAEVQRDSLTEQYLIFDIDHIIADGTSLAILIHDFVELYAGGDLSAVGVQYKDFAIWQNGLLESNKIEGQEQYWLEHFADEVPVLNLLTDYPRPAVRGVAGNSYGFELDADLAHRLNQLATNHGATLFMVLLAVYNVLLAKYTGQEDIVIGSPVAGRSHADLANVVGMFVNTLALRNYPASDKTFREFLSEVKENALEAFDHQDYQFETLVQKLNLQRDLSRNPLFDIMLVLQNTEESRMELPGVSFSPCDYRADIAKFDLTLTISENTDGLQCTLEYSTELFTKATMERMARHWRNLLEVLASEPTRVIKDITILSPEEESTLLQGMSMGDIDYPRTMTITSLFTEQVARTPERIAVVCGEESLTYRELNARANQLARFLQQRGVREQGIVALMPERSLEMIVGIFAILKAGAAYLPIDPYYPAERIEYTLQDSGSPLVLTQSILTDPESYAFATDNLPEVNTPTDLAYIIYTSGSTGMPKGVMIEHYNVVRLLFNDQFQFAFSEEDVWTMFHSVCFDFSVWEIYGALLYGGKLVVVPKLTAQNPGEFLELLKREQVTVLNQTPTAFYSLVAEELKTADSRLVLRYIIFGGEALKPTMLKDWYAKYPATQLINMYGITETTVHVTFKEITSYEIEHNISNIGRPIPTLTTYLMDKNLKLVPVGVVGEICVGGDGVGRGYLNRPELTAERFIANPYKPTERIYRSGDLARLLTNGEMEYLGRMDYQVKIRGFRIELSEIESNLLKHEQVKEVVVLDREDGEGEKYLCAYLVLHEGSQVSVGELRAYLGVNLPEYMIPSYFIMLDKFPMNSNGKVDRKALPVPEGNVRIGTEYVEPVTATEQVLAQIWSEVLGVERIGTRDNFFEIGGHSLKAAQLVGKINQAMHIELPLRQVFTMPTMQELAAYIDNLREEDHAYAAIMRAEEREYYPVSSAQKRLFVLKQIDEANVSYNIPAVLEIKGEVDFDRLSQAFSKLIERHEALRTSFTTIDGEAVQVVHDYTVRLQGGQAGGASEVTGKQHGEVSCALAETCVQRIVTERQIEEVVAEFVRPFDVSRAPLMRVALVEQTAADISGEIHTGQYLIIDIDHIIADGTSMGILVSDFVQLYSGQEQAELPIQYRDFAIWQNQLLQSGELQQQEEYWLTRFAGEVPVLNLLTDYPRPAVRGVAGDYYGFAVDGTLTGKLNQFALENGATLYMVLLAAYNVLMARYTGQEDIVIGSPVAGRSHAELEQVVGMFVNTLAIRNYPESKKTFGAFLNEVKESALGAFENQDYQFETLVERLNLQRDLSRNPIFDIMFVLQNTRQGQMEVPGLELMPYDYASKTSKFDLTLNVNETVDGLSCGFEYSTEIFARETIARLANHLSNLLKVVAGEPDIAIGEIEVLSEVEKVMLLTEFNPEDGTYPHKTLNQMFEEQVERTPERTAVIFGTESLTYRELNAKANRFAHYLERRGVTPGSIVAIMGERGIEMVSSILAIIKVGAAYLPIDPSFPADRIEYMLENSETPFVLTQEVLTDPRNYEYPAENLPALNKPEDVAYVLYTSGSTGRPKGVMIEHRNVIGLLFDSKSEFDFNQDDVWTLFHSFCFDLSVWEMYGALLYGGKVVVVPKITAQNPAEFLALMRREQATILTQTPTAFYNVAAEEAKYVDAGLALRFIIFAGEALKPVMLKDWYRKYPATKLINMYGITETTIHTTYKEIGSFEIEHNISNIGRPVRTYTTYLMDKNLKLVPLGVVGEICVGGAGVARGYLKLPELTAARFIMNPYKPTERIYRSGDLARMLPDGEMEYLGRMDHQVKIRGFRIELPEIESHLLKYAKVQEVVVIDRQDREGERYLAAYLVLQPGQEVSVGELRAYLGKNLPEYMIPSYFIILEKFPMNSNGKVDRRALPVPEGNVRSGAEYVAPATPIELALAGIWAEVLGVERVGVNDNFFEVGGHSLKAAMVAGKVNKALNVELPLRQIFQTPTIKELATHLEKRNSDDMESRALGTYQAIARMGERENYPVSSAQKRLFVLKQLDGANVSYNIPAVFEVEGALDLNRLAEAFAKLVQRHEALRTEFISLNGEPRQVVRSNVETAVQHIVSTSGIEKVMAEFVRPFDLGQAPLVRLALAEALGKQYLLFDIDHIVADGVSLAILVSDLIEIYLGAELPEMRIHYRDFAIWQNGLLNSGQLAEQETYWLQQFADELPVLDLPTDYPRPAVKGVAGAALSMPLGRELAEQLNQLAFEHGATLYMTLLAVYNVLMAKYTGQEDIVIGSPVAGRSHADLANVVGMFVNTLAMRNRPESAKTFVEFLREVKEGAMNAFENQDYQFESLVQKLNLQRDLSRNPIFDIVFVLQNTGRNTQEIPGVKLTPYDYAGHTAKFDLTLSVNETADGLQCVWEYSTEIFARATIERMANHWSNLLEVVVAEPEKAIGEIEILSAVEREEMLLGMSMGEVDYPRAATITSLFAEQVGRTPERIALVFGDTTMTYRELNAKANQLAHFLQAQGVQAGDIVAIMPERSLEMLIGIFAIMKAGAAYLPIDPYYPTERIEYTLADSGSPFVLTQEILTDPRSYAYPADELAEVNRPGDVAYIIYTSGSTGKPKGVMIDHYNVTRLMFNDRFQFAFGEEDVWTLFHSVCFDFSVWEMYGALLYGGKLVVVPKLTAQNPGEFLELLKREQVTVLNQTPTAFYNLVAEEMKWADARLKLRYIIFGGEALKPVMLKDWYAKYPATRLINMYGITETTVHVTYKEITGWEIEHNISNIGRPIPTLTTYLLDKNLKLVPVGVVGEICVGGSGVGRGYLNRPELTAEKFIPHPYKSEERIYRSGDLARLLANGEMEYLGRMDHQVKIRGFRIELQEIESNLLKHPKIQEALVLDRLDQKGERYLAAYIVTRAEVSVGELRASLAENLPEYMIPSYFIGLEKMPLTSNGKVDRKALPAPEGHLKTGREYVAPTNETESRLAHIWSEVLEVAEVGLEDNFFELGGHSLKAAQLVAKINREFGVELALREVFKASQLKELAAVIAEATKGVYAAIEPAGVQEYYPVSSAQKRMFILDQMEGADTAYNLPFVLEIDGQLDEARFDASWRKLVQRHEALRTSFELVDGEPVQHIWPEVELSIELINLAEEVTESAEQVGMTAIRKFVRPFDLQHAPLLRVGLLQNGDKQLLMFDMHHIISDGTSMGILVREFVKLYNDEELPDMRVQYKDYAVWQNALLSSSRLAEQEAHWLNRFADEIPVLNLPTDFARPSMTTFAGANFTFSLDAELAEGLKALAAQNGATLYMVLLAGFNVLLHRYTGQEDIVIGSPVAGRPHADLENIIGMFINTLAFRNQPMAAKTFKAFLSEVRENALTAFENQDYQFETLVEKLNLARNLSRNPLFDVVMVLQNTDTVAMEIADLKLVPYPLAGTTAKFDLTWNVAETANGLECNLEYRTDLYLAATIARMAGHLTQVLQEVVSNTDIKLGEIAMLSMAEQERILGEFNDTSVDYPREMTVHQIFEEQVRRNADKVAVVYQNQELTYAALNEKADALARLLRAKGVVRDQAVGILAERSLEMIVGVLAILKAGGAYLPINPDYPAERMAYMLADGQVQILLTQHHLREKVQYDCAIIDLGHNQSMDSPTDNHMHYSNERIADSCNFLVKDSQTNTCQKQENAAFSEKNAKRDIDILPNINQATDLAYIMYTSGSTGEPKGVMIEHRNILRLIINSNMLKIDREDRLTQTGSLAFDASTLEIWGALLNGATLYVISRDDLLSAESFETRLREYSISVLWLTTALFNQLLEENPAIFAGLRMLVVGGEVISVKHVNQALSLYPELTIINGYGPTENTTFTTYYIIDREYTGNIPIGRPVSNTQVYILSKEQTLQPIGVPGELCVAGDGLGRGYLNRPGLTQDKFVVNPFKAGERMYRTGDLARWLPDGNIEFLGRIDNQVKIRGFRIEPGEIEAQLLQHPAVKEVAVVDRTDQRGNRYLVAYAVVVGALTNLDLRQFLAQHLPDYMIPSYFVLLDKLPLNASGKINRAALPEPVGAETLARGYVAPTSAVEQHIAAIWSQILGMEQIGVNANFFEIGGHSLKAVQVISALHKQFGIRLSLEDLFKSPTIAELAAKIEGSEKTGYAEIAKLPEQAHYPLSYSQQRLWIIDQLEPGNTAYNIGGYVTLHEAIDPALVKASFEHIVQRHASLRTHFLTVEGAPKQVVAESVDLPFTLIDLSGRALEDITTGREAAYWAESSKSFDLQTGPLFRVTLVKISDAEYDLIYSMHHIISDGWSLTVLQREYAEIYAALQAGREPLLAELPVQYTDFAGWQNKLLADDRKMSAVQEFWAEQLTAELLPLALPVDYDSAVAAGSAAYRLVIPADVLEKLKTFTREHNMTLFMTVLAGFNLFLARITGQTEIVIGTPAAGREHESLKNLIGFFVNTLILRSQVNPEEPFSHFLERVHQNTLKALEYQDYPLELIVDRLQIAYPEIKVFLNMVNLFDNEHVELDNLEPYHLEQVQDVKFDLVWYLVEYQNGIEVACHYRKDRFKPETIEYIATEFVHILEMVTSNPQGSLNDFMASGEDEDELFF